MAYKVIVSRRATNRLLKILNYLNETWGQKVANDFAGKIENLLTLLEENPFLGAPSNKEPGVRRILLTKHNRVYYKVQDSIIYIVNIFDTRQNPQKNKFE